MTADAKARPLHMTDAKQTCKWSQEFDGNYDTECGQAFVFDYGGPADNGMNFCGYCGKRIKEVKYRERD